LTVVVGIMFEGEELVEKEPLGSVERGRRAIDDKAIDIREAVDGKKIG
jgi:hypothetical protein